MLLDQKVGRRRFLARSAAFVSGVAAISLVGCVDEEKEDQRVTEAKKKAEEYLLWRLGQWSGEMHPAIWTGVFALSLSGLGNKIRFANGFDVNDYVSQVTLTNDIVENLLNLERVVMVEAAAGKLLSVDTRNRYLEAALERGLVERRNDILAKALILNKVLGKKADSTASEELRSQLLRNRLTLGWGVEQESEIRQRAEPNTDINALAVLSGVGEKRLLDLSRSGNGWREYVLNTSEKANLFSTLWSSWAQGNMSEQTLSFVLAHQAKDGGFANKITGEVTEGATAEALAYFASRDNEIFARLVGS